MPHESQQKDIEREKNSGHTIVGQNSQESGGHSLVCSLVRSHRSLIYLFHTAHFAHFLACGTVSDWMDIGYLFCVSFHSGP